MSVSPLLTELMTTVPLGQCVICDGYIPPRVGKGRKRRLHRGECTLVYTRIHSDARRRHGADQ